MEIKVKSVLLISDKLEDGSIGIVFNDVNDKQFLYAVNPETKATELYDSEGNRIYLDKNAGLRILEEIFKKSKGTDETILEELSKIISSLHLSSQKQKGKRIIL